MNKKGQGLGVILLLIVVMVILFGILFSIVTPFIHLNEKGYKDFTPEIAKQSCGDLVLNSTYCPVLTGLFKPYKSKAHFGCWSDTEQEKIMRAKGCGVYGIYSVDVGVREQ